MIAVEESLVIDVPARELFAFLAEPQNLTIWRPVADEIRGVELLPGGLWRCRWSYLAGSRRLEALTELVERQPDERLVMKGEDRFPHTFIWTLRPAGAGTQLTLQAGYQQPRSLWGRLFGSGLRLALRVEVAGILSTLEQWFEPDSLDE
jgi:hypothetical protein